MPLAAFSAAPVPPLPPPVPASVHFQMPVVTPLMLRYSTTCYALYFFATFYGLIVLWGILASGLSAKLRAWASVLPGGRNRFAALCWYYLLFTVAVVILHAPLTFYSGYWLDHAYGLSSQSVVAWLGDSAKGIGVGYASGILVLAVLFTIMRKSPRRWSLWLWLVLVPIIAFSIFASPLVIDPLFNKFTPLPNGPLRTQIEQLAAKAGIPNAPILVADKSKQTDTTNAYVTGIGSSARIVLWDTLLKGKNKMPDNQIVAIVGHEMGHYVLKHIYLGFAEAIIGLLIALPLLQISAQWLIHRFGPRWRVTALTDHAAIPIFLLIFNFISFLSNPITCALSRHIEHAADAYGLAVTQNRVAMANAFVSLSEQNLDNPYPSPFIKFWLYTHPPLGERIEFALGRRIERAGK